jgi:hypothetical protein
MTPTSVDRDVDGYDVPDSDPAGAAAGDAGLLVGKARKASDWV